MFKGRMDKGGMNHPDSVGTEVIERESVCVRVCMPENESVCVRERLCVCVRERRLVLSPR